MARRGAGWKLEFMALRHVQISAAYATAMDFDDKVAGAGFGVGNLLDNHRLATARIYRGLHCCLAFKSYRVI